MNNQREHHLLTNAPEINCHPSNYHHPSNHHCLTDHYGPSNHHCPTNDHHPTNNHGPTNHRAPSNHRRRTNDHHPSNYHGPSNHRALLPLFLTFLPGGLQLLPPKAASLIWVPNPFPSGALGDLPTTPSFYLRHHQRLQVLGHPRSHAQMCKVTR